MPIRDEEILEEAPVEEEFVEEELPPTGEEEAVGGSTMSHTIEEMPELEGLAVGDVVTMRITNISEDGSTYDMEAMPAEEEAALELEAAPTERAGRAAVTEALL